MVVASFYYTDRLKLPSGQQPGGMRWLWQLGCLGGAIAAGPDWGGEQLNPQSKGFHDDMQIERTPMTYICSKCHACANPLAPELNHIEHLEDCEQACFFEAECRYIRL